MGTGVRIFRHFRPDEEEVDKLRGRDVFRIMNNDREFFLDLFHVMFPESGSWFMGRGIAFADLSAVADMTEYVAQAKEKGAAVILDVHFPLGSTEHVRTIRHPELDNKLNQHWSNRERIWWARKQVAQADVVTTSRFEWVPLLTPFNNNVIVLPDVQDADSGGEFVTRFIEAMGRAMWPHWYQRPKLWLWRATVKRNSGEYIAHVLAIEDVKTKW